MAAMAQSLGLQIQCMKDIDMSTATPVNAAVTSSAFSEEQRALLGQAIARKTMSSSAAVQKGPTTTQTFTSVCMFFTPSDLAQLQDERKTLSQLVQVVACRAAKLRVRHPNEATTKHLAAFVACFFWRTTLPTPAQAYSLTNDMKQAIQAHKQGGTEIHLPMYPACP
eukprot:2399709-Amphidinium_carterae.1